MNILHLSTGAVASVCQIFMFMLRVAYSIWTKSVVTVWEAYVIHRMWVFVLEHRRATPELHTSLLIACFVNLESCCDVCLEILIVICSYFQTVETTFIDDLKHLLLPFLLRCEKEAAGSRRQLLLDYLIFLSSQDLSLPHKLFEHLHNEHSFSLVPSMEEKISLALHCLYAYPEADQLSKAFHILECLPERGFRWAFWFLCLLCIVF